MDDRLEALERLARLRESGLLSEVELAAEKARILGDGPAPPRPASPSFHSLPRENPGFVSRHRWALAGGGGAILLTAFLVYIVFTLPPAAVGKEPARNETASVLPEGTPDLGVLLQGAPSTCGFGDEVRAILRNAIPTELPVGETRTASAIDVPGFPEPIAPRVRKLAGTTAAAPQATIVDLLTPGSWHGLRVIRLRAVSWSGGQIGAVHVRFAERAARVREVLNRAGFNVPPTGQLRSLDGEGRSVEMGIEAVPGAGTALICAYDLAATTARPAA
jgi:hypothetical protein